MKPNPFPTSPSVTTQARQRRNPFRLQRLLGTGVSITLLLCAAAGTEAGSNGSNAAIVTTGSASHQAIIFHDPVNAPTDQTPTSGLPANASPQGLAFFGDDDALVADSGNSRVFVIKVSTASVVSTIDTTNSYNGGGTLAVSPQHDYALAISDNNRLIAIKAPFDSSSAITSITLPGNAASAGSPSIVFNSAGRAFVRTSAGVSVLDAPYTSIAFTMPLSLDFVLRIGAIAITPDGNTLLVTNQNQGFGSTIYIFNAPFSASSTAQQRGTSSGLSTIGISPDGAKAILVISSTFGGRSASTLNAPFTPTSTGEALPLPAGTSGFTHVAFSGDSSEAILAGNYSGLSAGDPNEAPVLIKAPFTAAGSQSSYIPINGASPGRGNGTAQFLPGVGGTTPAMTGLRNISTRARVMTGDQVMIGGVIINGTTPLRVLFRAVGNSMEVDGQPVAGRLADPTLSLHDASGAEIAFNDNWGDAPEPERTEIIDSGLQPDDPQEPAILRTLAPGAYTVIVRGKNDTTGIALVEVYDASVTMGACQLGNLSTRAFVGTGDDLMIGGAIMSGAGTEVVVRGLGPSLNVNGTPIPGRLADPTLQVVNADGENIAENDNYNPADIPAELAPPDSAEAAIRLTLPAGNVTTLLRGKNDTTGIGLVEIFDITPATP